MGIKRRHAALFSMILAAAWVLASCATFAESAKSKQSEIENNLSDDTAEESVSRPYYYADYPYEGSLWSPHNSRSFLFVDNKARNINDIVTVRIIEQSDATRNATTQLSRQAGLKSNITKFFGAPLDFGLENLWGKNTGVATAAERSETPFQPDIETDSQNTFKGSGSILRKDKLIATITAKVIAVYPNGNLQIKGNREITINNEKQFIFLSGIIRPEDISADNTVVSTAIADAKISITGSGVISDKQDPGYGHRLFDWIWPF